jgi:hypothetical protein
MIRRVGGDKRPRQKMKSSSEANPLVHYEEFELAQSVKRELMRLRSRATMPSSEDVRSIACRAALVGSSHCTGRVAVDKIRAETWSAICKLAAAIDRNARLIEENRPDALVDTSLLWARAIDLGQVWMRAGEQLSRELADITTIDCTTTYRDIETCAFSGLPEAPTLAPTVGVNEEADESVTRAADVGTVMVRRILKAVPIGSRITFVADDIRVLLLASGPIVRGTEAYSLVEHLAQACNCSVSVQKKAGTISFCRNETEPVLGCAPHTQIPRACAASDGR